VSLLSLECGQLVSVSARLRRFCVLPSSAAAARPSPFGAHAAFASGAAANPPPRAQSLCCVLSQDDEGAELLVEAELRAPRWLTGDRLSFFRGALGRRVRLQAVRVQWSARADALALVDTEHTRQHFCRCSAGCDVALLCAVFVCFARIIIFHIVFLSVFF